MFLVSALVMVLLGQSTVFAKQQVIIYGDRNYPPYSYVKDGKPKGIYVEILESAFSKMSDYDVTIKMLPWKRGIEYVKQGKAVALFPPYYTEKRVPWMHYSEPILKEHIIVFGKSANIEGKTKWPEDFYGYMIGLNRGFNPYSMGGDKFGDACKTGKIRIDEANSTEQNLKKLEMDRIEFYINDKLINISSYPLIKRGVIANTNYGYLGFTKKGENYKFLPDFKKKFDQIIRKMKASKEIEKIADNYVN